MFYANCEQVRYFTLATDERKEEQHEPLVLRVWPGGVCRSAYVPYAKKPKLQIYFFGTTTRISFVSLVPPTCV